MMLSYISSGFGFLTGNPFCPKAALKVRKYCHVLIRLADESKVCATALAPCFGVAPLLCWDAEERWQKLLLACMFFWWHLNQNNHHHEWPGRNAGATQYLQGPHEVCDTLQSSLPVRISMSYPEKLWIFITSASELPKETFASRI